MSDRLRESVSALVDGEADELELRRLLSGPDREVMRGAWRDYHLLRDSLAGADMRFAQLDISGRVHAALAEEPKLTVAVGAARWWRPLASVAVAASMAAVVVVGVRGFGSGEPGAVQPLEVAEVQAPTAGKVYPAPMATGGTGNVAVSAEFGGMPAAQSPAADALAQQRLQHYLLRHTERAALNNGQGLISFARVSELDAE
jgi:sigma-E factor negative regulatory protein RseA